jgi:hypothetical protein
VSDFESRNLAAIRAAIDVSLADAVTNLRHARLVSVFLAREPENRRPQPRRNRIPRVAGLILPGVARGNQEPDVEPVLELGHDRLE